MRILFLAPQPFFQSRGTPIAARQLLVFLAEQGHAIDVLTYAEGEDVAIPGVVIHRIPRLPGVSGIRPGFSWKKLVSDAVMFFVGLRMARRTRYEMVHAIEESVFVAAAIKSLFGVPFVYDMDSSIAEQLIEQKPRLAPLRPVLAWLEGAAVRRSLGVLTVCRTLQETALAHDSAKLVAVVEDSSLLEPPDRPVDSLRQLTGDGPLVLYVGNLAPYQGIDLLLHSFVHTVKACPDARLLFIGGIDQRIAHYGALARDLGIAARVHFLGPRPIEHLGGYLEQADVLASPRVLGTNTPMKLYSYLDSGRAVIATRLPTHTQVLDDSIAMLVDPTPEHFGMGLARLLQDPELRHVLGRQARQRVQEEFTPQAARRKLLAFYSLVERELAQQGGPA
jgi:glycosyltransferase involved in cell wall biosynthesis